MRYPKTQLRQQEQRTTEGLLPANHPRNEIKIGTTAFTKRQTLERKGRVDIKEQCFRELQERDRG